VMKIDDEEREVCADDAIYIPRFARHTLTNTGDGPMKILLICGPAFFYEDHRHK